MLDADVYVERQIFEDIRSWLQTPNARVTSIGINLFGARLTQVRTASGLRLNWYADDDAAANTSSRTSWAERISAMGSVFVSKFEYAAEIGRG